MEEVTFKDEAGDPFPSEMLAFQRAWFWAAPGVGEFQATYLNRQVTIQYGGVWIDARKNHFLIVSDSGYAVLPSVMFRKLFTFDEPKEVTPAMSFQSFAEDLMALVDAYLPAEDAEPENENQFLALIMKEQLVKYRQAQSMFQQIPEKYREVLLKTAGEHQKDLSS